MMGIGTRRGVSLRDREYNRDYVRWIKIRFNQLLIILKEMSKGIAIRTRWKYFGWQPRFHDHIIRNERSLEAIRQYIRENPKRWGRTR